MKRGILAKTMLSDSGNLHTRGSKDPRRAVAPPTDSIKYKISDIQGSVVQEKKCPKYIGSSGRCLSEQRVIVIMVILCWKGTFALLSFWEEKVEV